jgi:putrescine transport system substrate-binding protein
VLFSLLAFGACLALGIAACSGGAKSPLDRGSAARAASSRANEVPIGSERILNVYNWTDFIDPSVISGFEKEYGIKVNYAVYDSNEQLETILLTGHANYDLVVPGGAFFEREVKAGIYRKLDKAQLPNLKNLDPESIRGMAVYDPGNQYGVPYMWLTTTGIGYDVARIKVIWTDAPINSWRMFFEPAVIKKFQDCGVSVLDAPDDVLSAVLLFLGKDPNSESRADLMLAEGVLLSIRPYIRYVDSTRYVEDLANGEICLALGWSGDITQARNHAHEAGKRVQIAYSIPKEGSISIFDMLAIPADAPHPSNAQLFINYLLRPEVAAKNSNATNFATPVVGSMAFINDALRKDSGVHPPAEVRAKLFPQRARSQEFTRLLTRMWTRFKTGI